MGVLDYDPATDIKVPGDDEVCADCGHAVDDHDDGNCVQCDTDGCFVEVSERAARAYAGYDPGEEG